MAAEWKEALLSECYKLMQAGGEVRIQFIIRGNEIVPIIRSYPENQRICKAVERDN